MPVRACVCALGQDQWTKSTLERVAQSSSPTQLSLSLPPFLCLSHLADVPLLPVHEELKSSRNYGAKEQY